ncbi:MAG: serine hydrolase, partial [Bryobacterales bacterium]|nr:serine hydrolase [Bryobacterales bacterium]
MFPLALLLFCAATAPALWAQPAAVKAAQSETATRLSRIAPRMKALADQGQIAGTVTLFAHKGQIVHFEAA